MYTETRINCYSSVQDEKKRRGEYPKHHRVFRLKSQHFILEELQTAPYETPNFRDYRAVVDVERVHHDMRQCRLERGALKHPYRRQIYSCKLMHVLSSNGPLNFDRDCLFKRHLTARDPENRP